MYIVSDDVLEHSVCSTCKKYLSVRPVKIYPNKSIKCGRCSTSTDGGAVSLVGILANNALFRCVNRFDGCNQLLTYSQVVEHEKLCTSDDEYECPVCTETFKASSYNVYRHFKEEHPKLFLKNTAMFNVEVDTELQRTYLYCKNDLLFFVTVRYCKSQEEFTMNTLHLGSEENASKISQNFSLESLDQKIKYTIRWNRCSTVNGNVRENKIQIKVDDFPKNVVVCKLSLNTEHADTLLVLPKDVEQRYGTLATVRGEETSVKSPLKNVKNTITITKGIRIQPAEKTCLQPAITKPIGILCPEVKSSGNVGATSKVFVESTKDGIHIQPTKETLATTKPIETLPPKVKSSGNVGATSKAFVESTKNERPVQHYTPPQWQCYLYFHSKNQMMTHWHWEHGMYEF